MVSYRKPSQVPVDRGWAWVILGASFMGLFLLSLIYMNGIFQVVFLEVFQKDKFTTSWVSSINGSLLSFTGPLSSYMTRRLGSRVTVIIGSIVGTTGFVVAAFSQTFIQLFLAYGIVVGIGFGISYLPCAVAVGFYFDKYRNVSFGLINMSVGLATMVMSPFVTWANDYYGWRGTMLILGGLYLQMCVVGAVLRPVQLDPSPEVQQRIFTDPEMAQIVEEAGKAQHTVAGQKPGQHERGNGHLDPAVSTPGPPHLGSRIVSHLGSVRHVSRGSYLGSRGSQVGSRIMSHIGSAGHLPPSLAYAGVLGSAVDVRSGVVTSGGSLSHAHKRPRLGKHPDNNHVTSLCDVSAGKHVQSHERLTRSEYDLARSMPPGHDGSHWRTGPGPPLSPLVPPSAPLRRDSEGSQADTLLDSVYSSHLGPLGSVSVLNHTDAPPGCCCRKQSCGAATCSPGLLRDPAFLLYCGMNLLVCLAVSVAYQHLPDYVSLHGTSSGGAAVLLSLIGVSNCVSRLVSGLAINNESIDPLLIQFGSNGVVGIVFLFMPLLVQTFAGQVTFALMFGFYANCYVALLGPITIKIVGLENLSHAYGILLILCGTGFVFGSPLAGFMFDLTQRFESSFVSAGVCFLLASVIIMPIPGRLVGREQHADIVEVVEQTREK